MSAFVKATAAIGVAVLLVGQPATVEQQQQPFQVETDTVRVPVAVIDEDREVLLTDLSKDQFILLEDGEPQEISQFVTGEAERLNVVTLLEFSRQVEFLRSQILRPAAIFVSQVLRPPDYAALISFDSRPHIHSDFTRNRQQLLDAVQRMFRSPTGMSESNLYDSVAFSLIGGELEDTLYQGLAEVEGRTALLVITTTINTFSRNSFDDLQEIVAAAGVPVYVVDIGQMVYVRYEHRMSGLSRMTYLQQSNALRHLCEMSGGRYYPVRFEGAFNSVLESLAQLLRFQFVLGYQPSDLPEPGEDRKIEVLVDLDGDGEPDEDLEISHRERYTILSPEKTAT